MTLSLLTPGAMVYQCSFPVCVFSNSKAYFYPNISQNPARAGHTRRSRDICR